MLTTQPASDPGTFSTIVELVGHIAWPIVALIIMCWLRAPISTVVGTLKKLKYKDWEASFEIEEGKAPGSNAADLLKLIVQNGPHSFEWIRNATPLKLSDDEFGELIKSNPTMFQHTTIIRRNEEGERVTPGWPGVRLKTGR